MASVIGTSGNNTLNGTNDADTILGNGGADTIDARGGDDVILPGVGGNDTIDGGAGSDTLILNGAQSQYTISYSGTSIVLTNTANGAVESVTGVEHIIFDDASIRVVGAGSELATIQAGVVAAQNGETVLIAPGTYNEQVVVDNKSDLTIMAAPGANVTIQAPADVHETVRSSSNRPTDAVVTVTNSTNVNFVNINVDGAGHGDTVDQVQGAADANFVGVAYRNASGGLTDVNVTGVRDPVLNGAQRGFGVLVDNDSNLDFSMTGGSISDFQKNGAVFNHANLNVSGVTVTGAGALTSNAQNGIEVLNSTGTVSGNTVTGVGYAGPLPPYSGAILAAGNSGLAITNNTIIGANIDSTDAKVVGVLVTDFGNPNSGYVITGNAISYVDEGVDVSGAVGSTGFTIANNTVTALDLTDPAPAGVYFSPDPTSSVAHNVRGTGFADFLAGGAGDDTLVGLGGDDIINGGGGADTMIGGGGNDIYFVDNAGDTITEAANGGTDTVYASTSYALNADAQVENLVLTDLAYDKETFENFNLGPITDGENDWKYSGSISDQGVIVDPNDPTNKVFHMSSDPDVPDFSGPYSPELALQAGEPDTGAAADTQAITFDFRAVSASGDNSRMEVDFGNAAGTDRNNFLAIENIAGQGLRISVNEPLPNGDFANNDTSAFTGNRELIAGVDASKSHSLSMVVHYVDGPNNDVVSIYLDGALIGTSTTFENFHDFNNPDDHVGNAQANLTDRVFFRGRASGAPTDGPGGQNQGFLFDNIQNAMFAQNETLTGNDFGQTLTGNSGDNTLNGEGGDDTLIGRGGNDAIDGGTGSDTAVFSGNFVDYTVTRLGPSSYQLVGPDGTDTVSNVETFQFADGSKSAEAIFNDAPVASDEILSVNEGGSLVQGSVTATDQDIGSIPGETLTFSLNSPRPAGLIFNSDGSYTFDPTDLAYNHLAAGEILQIDVPYTVTDSGGKSGIATLTINISGTNDAPVAVTDIAATTEDAAPITGSVAANDTDVDDGAMLSYALNGDVAGLILNADGSYSFDASNAAYQHLAQGVSIPVVASYTVTDDHGLTATSTLTITVTGVNDAPVAVADTASATEDAASVTGSVATNDGDVDDGAVLSYALNAPVVGLTLNANGSYSFNTSDAAYQHLAQGETTDVVANYTVTDDHGATATSTLTITVTGVNDTPTAVADTAAATEDAPPLTGSVATNDSDVDDGAVLNYTLNAPVAGLTLNGNGSYTFDPSVAAYQHLAQGATTDVVANYTVTDDHGATANSTLTITVTGVNDAPVARSDSFAAMDENQPASLDVLANDTDADVPHSLSVTAISASGTGKFDGVDLSSFFSYNNATGKIDFNPGAGAGGNLNTSPNFGTETVFDRLDPGDASVIIVNYTVSDGLATSSSYATFTVNGKVETFIGSDGDDTINGTAYQDYIDGGAGDDMMSGGNGNDTYVVDSTSDIIVENANAGTDTVFSSADSYTLSANVENLTLVGNAESGIGNSLSNTLTGNDGANVLDGGAGADFFIGGGGDDTYYVDSSAELTRITETVDGGYDTLVSNVSVTTLAANVEAVQLGALALNANGNELDNQLTGNSLNNTLDGKGGADAMTGGAGNDTYYVDNADDSVYEAAGGGTDTVNTTVSYTLTAGQSIEKLQVSPTAASGANINLTGNEFANTLIGNTGANVLDGKGGADAMTGGSGDDTYYVDNAGDRVFEANNGGFDRVLSSVNFALAAGQEIETLLATNAAATTALSLTGNEFAQSITGNAGNNSINGGGGADTMTGLGGNDIYYVDNIDDKVFEATGGGTDTVLVTTAITYALAAGQEIETLRTADPGGTLAINLIGNALNNQLVGNAAANSLNGGAGADIMRGGAGDDTYNVDNANDFVDEAVGGGSDLVQTSVSYALAAGSEVETLQTSAAGLSALSLTGNQFAQTINGNAGNNTIDGGAGADTLQGRGGDDTYFVDNVNDRVNESAGGGNDTVIVTTAITYTLAAGQEIETLKTANAAGTLAINLTGNGQSNTLIGNAAANILNGGAGADSMTGGAGSDTYYVDNAGDQVFEAVNGGADIVLTSVSYALANGQEIEALATQNAAGTAGLSLIGNDFDQAITGNAGANLITGGAGADVLTGGAGADIFSYAASFGQDRITDFTAGSAAGHDLFRMANSVFSNYADVMAHTSDTANGAIITLDPNNSITLTGVTKSSLVASDFSFT